VFLGTWCFLTRDSKGPSRLHVAPLAVLSLGLEAGRHPGWVKNCDRFKIAAQASAIGRALKLASLGEFSLNTTKPRAQPKRRSSEDR
jgi:hypothetical protein